MVSKDKGILYLIWIVTAALLFKYIPRNKIRHGLVIMLFKHVVTWFFGLLVVEKGFIQYPVRFFRKANRTSFTFEYFVYPAFCAIFNLNYPENRNKIIQLLYYLFHVGIITTGEVIAEKYTNLIKYVKWKWYWSFITLSLTNFSSRVFYRWFYKEEFKVKESN
ncbi:CBO0543 family protein [Guptibacillus hwajinpoensis]|uniref:CBO0543 family protein n=1 Tax=Guptibacillus hwajinpoensis TaxID=208199 RepID=UPI001CFCE884|nr:CBO0543 family protein [Pseudalkalibacillus hwajinpoensis]WLR59215.1 CBO0543 family protein [Pseudalkalibacillus hwajinpoensis]